MFQQVSTQKNDNSNKYPAIILIHGLARTSRSMSRLARFLNKIGFDCYLYSYESRKLSIVEHSQELLLNLTKLLERHNQTRFSLVTHSLGGILARDALSKMNELSLKQFDKMIMLAPPNKGSKMANIAITTFPFLKSYLKPLLDLTDDPKAYVHQVSTPKYIKFGVIAARLDAKTPPSQTYLKEQSDFIIINSTHTFIMNHYRARQAIVNFLKKGSFDVNNK